MTTPREAPAMSGPKATDVVEVLNADAQYALASRIARLEDENQALLAENERLRKVERAAKKVERAYARFHRSDTGGEVEYDKLLDAMLALRKTLYPARAALAGATE